MNMEIQNIAQQIEFKMKENKISPTTVKGEDDSKPQ